MDIHEHGGVFTGNPELGDVVGYSGLTTTEMAEQFATYRVVDGVDEKGWWMGGYEEMDVCYTRACRVAERLFALYDECEGSTIALVTHGTFLDALMHALFVPDEAVRQPGPLQPSQHGGHPRRLRQGRAGWHCAIRIALITCRWRW